MKLQIGDYPDLEMSPLDFTIDIHCKKGFYRFYPLMKSNTPETYVVMRNCVLGLGLYT